MSKPKFAALIGAVILVLGAALFLMTREIPAPSARVEKTLSDDRFPS
ncbi:hypothetical protein [Yunchengibacter salinarum]